MDIRVFLEKLGLVLARRVVADYEARLAERDKQIATLQDIGAFVRAQDYPPPPEEVGIVPGWDVEYLARQAFGCPFPGGPMDAWYALTSIEEYQRFLTWYNDKRLYTADDYDCDKYAWVMRAEALRWMGGRFVFGYVEAEGVTEGFEFPNHGFNWVLDSKLNIYFCDELCLAAPRDEFVPAYPVRCYGMVKA